MGVHGNDKKMFPNPIFYCMSPILVKLNEITFFFLGVLIRLMEITTYNVSIFDFVKILSNSQQCRFRHRFRFHQI